MNYSDTFVSTLKLFVDDLLKDPSIVEKDARLAFLKDYYNGISAFLKTKGVDIREAFINTGSRTASSGAPADENTSAPPQMPPPRDAHSSDFTSESELDEEETEKEEEEELPLEDPRLEEDSQRIDSEETTDLPKATLPADHEITEEAEAALTVIRKGLQTALEDDDKQTVLKLQTELLLASPKSAMLYCKRADTLLKMKRPRAAISDCNEALLINGDYARAYRIRGTAHRLIGEWEKASRDIATAQSIDYDDDLHDLEKLVSAKARAIEAFDRKVAAREKAKLTKERVKAHKRAVREYERMKRREEAAKAKECCGGMPGSSGCCGGMPDAFPGSYGPDSMPGSMPGAGPNLSEKIRAALAELQKDPSKISKYLNDPDFAAAMAASGIKFPSAAE